MTLCPFSVTPMTPLYFTSPKSVRGRITVPQASPSAIIGTETTLVSAILFHDIRNCNTIYIKRSAIGQSGSILVDGLCLSNGKPLPKLSWIFFFFYFAMPLNVNRHHGKFVICDMRHTWRTGGRLLAHLRPWRQGGNRTPSPCHPPDQTAPGTQGHLNRAIFLRKLSMFYKSGVTCNRISGICAF